jgi:hypothetical protein
LHCQLRAILAAGGFKKLGVRRGDQDRAPPGKVTLTDIFLLFAELFQPLNPLIDDSFNFGSMELLFRRIGDAAQLKLLFDSFLPGRLPNLESFTLFGSPRVLRQHSRKLG